MKPNLPLKIGSAIKKCRQLQNITLKDLAKRICVSVAYLSLVENEQRRVSLDRLETIAAALGVPIYVVIYLATDKSKLAKDNPALKAEFDKLVCELADSGADT